MNHKNFILIASSLALVQCSSRLNQSNFDLTMRMHGTYMCPMTVANTDAHDRSIHHETFAEADVGRIRCYQDKWTVNGDDLSMTRIFYQSEHCENPLGQIQYEKEAGKPGSCEFNRSNPGWVAEDKGICLFKDLPPNQWTSITPLLKCSRNLPPQCLHLKAEINLSSKPPESGGVNEEITLSSNSGYHATCKRYLQ